MKLFEVKERTALDGASPIESEYSYLDRSGRASAEQVRILLERWFRRYPRRHRSELLARFRGDHGQSAFFELFLHALVRAHGCRAKIHPELPHSRGRPDFLLSSPRWWFQRILFVGPGLKSYLEAVVATEESHHQSAVRACTEAVLEEVNQIESPNFVIGVGEVGGPPDRPPSPRRVRRFLENRLARLDPNDLPDTIRSYDQVPHVTFEHNGWRIEFLAIPIRPEFRGRTGGSPIGLRQFPVEWVRSREIIRKQVVDKANKYGRLGAPLVIAVNAMGRYVDREEILQALYGTLKISVRMGSAGLPEEPREYIADDGAFRQYTRLSAVVVATRLSPWSLADARLTLFHNPWATRPYTGCLTALPQCGVRDDGRFETRDGPSVLDCFGLPAGWPGPD